MKKRIAQSSHCLLVILIQEDKRLLWTLILLLFVSISASAHFPHENSSNCSIIKTEDTCPFLEASLHQEIANPSVIIFIEPVADICLNSNTGLTILSVTIQGGDGSGIGVWSGPGVVLPNYFNPALANIGPNLITYTFVEHGFVVIETTIINVYFSPTANFSINSPICANEYASLSTTPVNGSVYDWDFSGGNVFSGSGAGPYEIGWTDEGTYPVSLTVTDINGCTSNTFTQMVSVVAPLSTPLISCNTDTSTIEFSWDDVDGALGYTINVLLGPPGILNGNTYTVSALNNYEAVTIELKVLGSAPCGNLTVSQTCYATDCSNIRLSLDSVPDFCLTSDIMPFALTANVMNNTDGTGVWAGNGIIDVVAGIFDPNDPSVNFGSNIISYTFTEQACSFTETMSINVMQVPEIRLAAIDDLDCNTEAVVLNASGSSISPNINIEWFGPTGGITGQVDNLSTTVILPGTYTLTLTDMLNGCKNDTSFVVRQLNDSPIATTNVPDDLDCHNVEVEVNGFNSTGENVLDFEWIYNETIISQYPSINVTEQGTYTLIVTDPNNKCSDTTFVDVFENPHILTGADIRIQSPSCHGENDGIISVDEVFGGTSPFEFMLDSISFDNANNISGLGAGEYVFTIVDQENCSWDTTFTIHSLPALELEIGNDITLQLGENTTISAQFNLPDTMIHSLVWSPTESLVCMDTLSEICTQVFTSPLTNLLVSATLTDINGCSLREEILIQVNKDRLVYIPNIFTPNGDTQNDVFTIFANQGVEKINRFFVYDRWGELMFESYNFQANDPTFGWDGKLKGKPLNPAVFIYWAEVSLLDGQTIVFSGDVTLLR